MKLLNLPPVKVGQYVRYKDQYIWKCSGVSLNRHKEWLVKGNVVVSFEDHAWRPGMPIDGFWYADEDRVLTEEEANEIIERTTV